MKHFIFVALISASLSAFAAKDHPLCDDIIRFACSPGEQKDGTGSVKSEKQIRDENFKLLKKYEAESEKRVKEALKTSKDPAFRDVAKSVLGMTHADYCNSQVQEDIDQCNKELEEGITTQIQKEVLGSKFEYPGEIRKISKQDLVFLRKNEAFAGIVKELKKEAQEESDAKVRGIKKEISKKFPDVQKLIVEKINSMPIDEDHKKFLIKRINMASFDEKDCDDDDDDSDKKPSLSKLLLPNAHYNQVTQKFRFCNAFLERTDSMFSIIGVMIHEITHALGPCAITIGPRDLTFEYSDYSDLAKMQAEYPLSSILTCLRAPNSVHAQRIDSEAKTQETSKEKSSTEGTPAKEQNSETKQAKSPPKQAASNPENNPFCFTKHGKRIQKTDQVEEAIPDWFAAELTPKFMAANYELSDKQYRIGYSNIFRPICENEQGSRNKIVDQVLSEEDSKGEVERAKGFDIHPPLYKRLNNIFLAQPDVRAQMGCSPKHPKFIHCTGETGYQYQMGNEVGPSVDGNRPAEPPTQPSPSKAQK